MKPLKDYSFVNGVCHNNFGDREALLREIGYAKRLGVNSFRTWLPTFLYKKDPDKFMANTKQFIELSWENGITTMPILFNGNSLDPAMLEPVWWEEFGDDYVKKVVGAFKDEPGLIMWDIMNEPSCNDYIRKAPEGTRDGRWAEVNTFLKHYCELVRELDPEGTITIGHTFAEDLEPSSAWVDVVCVHDYLESEELIQKTYDESWAVANKYGKPLINSELSCIGRANPYELSIKKARENNVGTYVFELMIHGYWGDIHGLVYPDGTVRDPSVIASMLGFYRKLTPDRIKQNPNKEGKAEEALARLRTAMNDSAETFHHKAAASGPILEAAEWVINLLEGSEMVAMYNPPSAKLLAFKNQPEAERDLDDIKAFAAEMAEILKKNCYLI